MTNTNETKVVKVTKVQKFGKIIEILAASTHADKEMLIDAMQHEIELLERKKTSGVKSKTAQANEEFKEIILEVLATAEKPVTVTELMQLDEKMQEYNGNTITNQKLSRLLNDMTKGDTPKVVKTIDKKKSYFALA